VELAAYEQFATLEEEHFWFRGRRAIFFAVLDRYLKGRQDLDILEIVCGAGGLLRRLKKYGNPKGLELSFELSVMSRERSACLVVCGDAYGLPFENESQDLLCLFDAIEHIPDEARVLAEIHRVLRPGGLVFFSVPAYPFLYANNDRVAHHCRRYTAGHLKRVCQEAGLEKRRLSYFNSFLFPLILPTVLFGKLKEKMIGLEDPDHTNLSYQPKPFINGLLAGIMGSERHIQPFLSFPTGHSLWGLFEKKT